MSVCRLQKQPPPFPFLPPPIERRRTQLERSSLPPLRSVSLLTQWGRVPGDGSQRISFQDHGRSMRPWVTLVGFAILSLHLRRFSVHKVVQIAIGNKLFLEPIVQCNSLKNGTCAIASIRPSNKPMGVFVFARPLATLNLIKLRES